MQTKLIRIGNSQGVRIPKLLLEQVGLRDNVELRAEEGRLIIQPGRALREGWEQAFAANTDQGDQGDDLTPFGEITNRFDREEWNW
jgi:antitoxin MazE